MFMVSVVLVQGWEFQTLMHLFLERLHRVVSGMSGAELSTLLVFLTEAARRVRAERRRRRRKELHWPRSPGRWN